ncbi:hypothetical protein BsWGS_03974 [Bradybaena similaris]
MAACTGKTRGHRYIVRCVGLVLLALQFAEADETSMTKEIPNDMLKGIKSLTAPSEDGLNIESLPTNVEPILYELSLFPTFFGVNPEDFTFKGIVSILLKCHIDSREITLHSEGLTLDIKNSKFYDAATSDHEEYTVDIFQEEGSPLLKVILNHDMKIGRQYWLKLHFHAPLRSEAKGLYYREYTTEDGTEYFVATRLIPTYARRVFPCFDEPALKARFRVTLFRPENYEALTNTQVLPRKDHSYLEEHEVKIVKDEFRTSPLMSTFALAIFIGDFISSKDTRGKYKYQSFIQGDSHPTEYARKSLIAQSEAYRKYFGFDYRIIKSDMVAVPETDTAFHWGLDLFRDTSIVRLESEDSVRPRAEMHLLMGLRTAHAYFGNLVTPLWWNDVWLMEGMSNYYQYWALVFQDKTWKMWDKFIFDKVQTAFHFDGIVHDKTVIRNPETVDEIDDMFDWVMCTKVPALIRMLSFIVGDAVFETAVKKYLVKFKENVTTTKDFFDEIQKEVKAVGKSVNVSNIMKTWFYQPNYPLVSVTRDFHNHSLIYVYQTQFLRDPPALGSTDGSQYSVSPFRWTIPLTFMTSASPDPDVTNEDIYWLESNETHRELTISNSLAETIDFDGWILLNVNQRGYYRVNYQSGNWKALVKQLKTKHDVIPTINRAQIINDAWALTKAEYLISMSIALETLDYLEAERDFLPWQTAAAEFEYLEYRFSYTKDYGGLKSFMRKKLETPFVEMLKTEKEITSYSLITIAEQACYYGVPACVEHAKQHYNKHMKNYLLHTIPPQIRRMASCIAIANGDWPEFQMGVSMYTDVVTDAIKSDFLYAITCTRKPWIIRVLLGLLFVPKMKLTPENALNLLYLVMKNPYGRYLAWDYYRNNYLNLVELYPTLTCKNALPVITEFFHTHLEHTELRVFVQEKCNEADSELEDSAATIKRNIRWTEENSLIVTAWLKYKGHFIQ